MACIKMSKQFFDILCSITKVMKLSETLFYKDNGVCHINIPGPNTMLHLFASAEDFWFDDETVNISSLMEFCTYAKLCDYPEQGTAEVEQVMSRNGRPYEYIKFSTVGSGAKSGTVARTVTADNTCFKADDRKTPSAREADRMRLLCTMALGKKQLTEISTRVKKVPGCEYLSVIVTGEQVKLYLKGKVAQQITYVLDNLSVRIEDEAAIAEAYPVDRTDFRMFSASYFSVLHGLGFDFETEVRHIKRGNSTDVMSLKSYASVVGANAGIPITVFYGAMESASATISNYDIVE